MKMTEAAVLTGLLTLPMAAKADNWDRSCMSAPTTVNVDRALDRPRARADFLQARITECRSVGCATSRLSDY